MWKHTSLFIIAVAVVTFFLPNLFSWLKGTKQTVIIGMGMFISIRESVFIPIAVGFLLHHFLGEKEGFKDIRALMPGVAVTGLATNLATLHFAAFPQAALISAVSCA